MNSKIIDVITEFSKKELGNKIATLRLAAGWSQEFLGKQVGVSRQTIASWEKGETSPKTDHLFKVARVFGVKADELKEAEKE